jgi:hypothetical protein
MLVNVFDSNKPKGVVASPYSGLPMSVTRASYVLSWNNSLYGCDVRHLRISGYNI